MIPQPFIRFRFGCCWTPVGAITWHRLFPTEPAHFTPVRKKTRMRARTQERLKGHNKKKYSRAHVGPITSSKNWSRKCVFRGAFEGKLVGVHQGWEAARFLCWKDWCNKNTTLLSSTFKFGFYLHLPRWAISFTAGIKSIITHRNRKTADTWLPF